MLCYVILYACVCLVGDKRSAVKWKGTKFGPGATKNNRQLMEHASLDVRGLDRSREF